MIDHPKPPPNCPYFDTIFGDWKVSMPNDSFWWIDRIPLDNKKTRHFVASLAIEYWNREFLKHPGLIEETQKHIDAWHKWGWNEDNNSNSST